MAKQKVTIKNATGLSLRPTEQLYKVAMRYKSSVTIKYDKGQANLKSILSVLGSGIKCGDEITVHCDGSDAEEALDAVVTAIEEGLEE